MEIGRLKSAKREINLNNEYIRTDGYDEKIKDFSRTGAGTSVYSRTWKNAWSTSSGAHTWW